MLSTRGRYFAILGGLTFVNVLLVWLLPVLPAQDLPQHLAYARIILDFHDPNLQFPAYYTIAPDFQSYYTVHYVLAFFGSGIGILGAIRLLVSLYAIAIPLAFHDLVNTVQEGEPGPHWTGLFGLLFVWNPAYTMGFISFALTIPIFIWAVSRYLRFTGAHPRPKDGIWLGVLCALLVSLHIVAAGCFFVFAILHTIFNWTRRRAMVTGGVFGAIVIVYVLWSSLGHSGVGRAKIELTEALRKAHGLEFVNDVFRITWYDPPVTISYVFWTVFGPYRWLGELLVALAMIATVAAVWSAKKQAPATPPTDNLRAMRRTAIAFGIFCWLTPWGFYVPSEITFLNFRMFTMAFALGLAAVAPRLLIPKRAQLAAALLVGFVTFHYVYRAARFAGEANDALSLMAKTTADDGPMMTLPFHNKSDQFGKIFRITHFLPMYYTVIQGGISAQFWARYTPHLPVDYQKGRQPAHTTDWDPWQFQLDHLKDSKTFIVQWANGEDQKSTQESSKKVQGMIGPRVQEIGCKGLWCLYRVVPK